MNWIQLLIDIFRPRPIPTPVPTPVPTPTPPPSGDVQQQLLALHNNHRQSMGLRPLNLNAKLNTAAQKHSNWMLANNTLNHNENGVGPGTRITNEGYKWRTYGENIAMDHANAQAVFQLWLNSPGHRANIENPNFVDCGFGNAGSYWTTDFGATANFFWSIRNLW